MAREGSSNKLPPRSGPLRSKSRRAMSRAAIAASRPSITSRADTSAASIRPPSLPLSSTAWPGLPWPRSRAALTPAAGGSLRISRDGPQGIDRVLRQRTRGGLYVGNCPPRFDPLRPLRPAARIAGSAPSKRPSPRPFAHRCCSFSCFRAIVRPLLNRNHPPRWLLRARRPGGEQLARRPSQFRRLASPAVQESGRLQRKGRRASAFLLSAAIGNSCSPPRRTSSGSAATQTGVKVIGGRIRQLLHRLQASTLSLYDRQRIALASASASAAAVAAMRA